MNKFNLVVFWSSFSILILFLSLSCAGTQPSYQTNSATETLDLPEHIAPRSASAPSNIVSDTKKIDQRKVLSKNKKNVSDKNVILKNNVEIKSHKKPYSNYIRVKTVYELAMDANPSMFLPHDEFETVNEYKERVSGQVELMKEIVQMTTQKFEIKKARRLKNAEEKELKRKAIIETLMSESSSQVEFKPSDIGRYDAENETFPIALHDTQYQIYVPREEARTFKASFDKVKIKGIKQLKPKYDIMIKVPKAHIRSRPNGSIIGIASNLNQFEHIQDLDEWYKINYKGQFGFTHKNNASLKVVDIANEYEFYDLVAIHPNTGSLYAMTSIDKLVKAPLNLASRKYETGQPDGPKE